VKIVTAQAVFLLHSVAAVEVAVVYRWAKKMYYHEHPRVGAAAAVVAGT